MSILSTFKQWVETAVNPVEAIQHDDLMLCDYFAIPTTNGYRRADMTAKILEKMQDILKASETETSLPPMFLKDLRDALVYDTVLSGLDNTKALTIVKMISGRGDKLKDFSFTHDWEKAIGYAKAYESIEGGVFTVDQDRLREEYPRQHDTASAYKKLCELGAKVELDDLVLTITDSERIAQKLESDIESVGGYDVMALLFAILKKEQRYFPVYRRYLIYNQVGNIPHYTGPMIPYGFLLNLCVKHPERKLTVAHPSVLQQQVNHIIESATLLGTMLDIRDYSNLDRIFPQADNFAAFITQMGLFDSTFGFPSYELTMIIDFMEGLFKWLDTLVFSTKFGFAPADLVTLTHGINQSAAENGPQLFTVKELQELVPSLDAEKIEKMLVHLSHKKGEVNKDYTFFYSYDKLDFGFKPLIKTSTDQYLLCDKSWCAAGFYEVMATLARMMDTRRDECNNRIGGALEQFIYKKFTDKNIVYATGNYADGTKPDGEADAIIESEPAIVLVELKKKVLTRKAKTGSDVQLMIDLGGSLLDAQVQTGRTELLLRKNGHIDLATGGGNQRIVFGDRQIERIALTHWDFGSFQDRIILNSILTALVNTDIRLISEDDENARKSFVFIDKKVALFRDQATELAQLDDRFADFPFFNCWFLSVPQLLTILNYSNGNEEFQKALFATRHVSLGTYNFYAEFYQSFIRNLA